MAYPSPTRILITGSKGRLASCIQKLVSCTAIDKDDLDITNSRAVSDYFSQHAFDIVIHCAAFTDVAGAEQNKEACYEINVLGTEYLVKAFAGTKFVYISTEYVFDGARGMYTEEDIPNPVNYYALTKLLGEMAVRQHPHTLIIRTSFKPDGPWPYPKAFIDQFTSADYVSERAPQILRAALMPDVYGTLHIGGMRKSVYDLARIQTPTVGQMSLRDIATTLPKDVSLDSSRWQMLINND